MHIHLRMDYQTAVYYVNHMGGTQSPAMSRLAIQLRQWCVWCGQLHSRQGVQESSVISRIATGSKSVPADNGSVGKCSVGLCASQLNAQLQQYMSWRQDSNAIALDAQWTNWTDRIYFPTILPNRQMPQESQRRGSIKPQ